MSSDLGMFQSPIFSRGKLSEAYVQNHNHWPPSSEITDNEIYLPFANIFKSKSFL